MKFLKLSVFAISASLSFATAMPAEASIFSLVLQRKHHHSHEQHQQHQEANNSHRAHHESNSNHHRVNYYRNRHRNHRWSNHRSIHDFPRRRVSDRFRIYGNWRRRY